ncbi:hypothetical protein MMC08_004086 [Hypocenomyce scalaris]|nr:hypothetical protein [Hypocenomyce scalaris]
MKPQSMITLLLAGASIVTSLSIPNRNNALSQRETEGEVQLVDAPLAERFDESLLGCLEKRRGGGGSSGGGGRGGGSSSSGSSSSGSSSSGSSSSGSSSGSSGASSSGAGAGSSGRTSSTSSVRPSYGGGKYYGGGATTAYSAGARSPLGITPYLIGGAALGIFPGLWLYGAYAYPYSHSYSFVNRTDTNSSNPNGVNETLPVTCLCQEYSACGCDDNGNTTYVGSLLGNGSAADMNSSLVTVSPVNGTKTVVINGTLPNGTTTTSAAGPGVKQTLLESSGFWLVGAIVGYTVWLT